MYRYEKNTKTLPSLFALKNSIWEHSRAENTARLVLLCLADHADPTGFCFPGVERIARRCKKSSRTVQRCLRILVFLGEIEIYPNAGPRAVNSYRVFMLPRNGVVNNTLASERCDMPEVTIETKSGDRDVTQTTSEPSNESTPIVPYGDDVQFWLSVVFKCFNYTSYHLDSRYTGWIRKHLSHLNREDAPSLLCFYEDEPLDSRKHPFNLRKRKPETLIRHLPAMVHLALELFPPWKPPPEPPKWRERLAKGYPDAAARIPAKRSFWDLRDDLRESIREAIGPDPPTAEA